MRSLPLAFLTLALPIAELAAQNRAYDEFQKRKTKALAENGQRHLRLGSWARDQGLVPQATAEFLLAVEVAEGRNPGAITVLGIMRSLDEAFWTTRRTRPSRALLDSYDKRAKRARRQDHVERLKLAWFAYQRKLEDEALREYRSLVGDIDDALEIDGKGRIVLEVGTVPADLSAKILAQAVEIEDRQYLADDTLKGLPDPSTVREETSPELRVRGTLPEDRIQDLHALGLALLPHLEEQIGGRPVQRVQVFVFGKRAEYAAYLAAHALQRYANASGVADYNAQQAVVCAEGFDEEQLRGLFLHELVHLYDYQVAPTALPSWYREAFAESIGGPGAYRWDNGALALGGEMSPGHLQILKDRIDGFALRELLDADAGMLFAQDAERARRFYLEAWAFLAYLRGHAGEDVAERFAVWEAMCRGKALGAQPRQPGKRERLLDESDAREAFTRMFGGDLEELESGFLAWVAGR